MSLSDKDPKTYKKNLQRAIEMLIFKNKTKTCFSKRILPRKLTFTSFFFVQSSKLQETDNTVFHISFVKKNHFAKNGNLADSPSGNCALCVSGKSRRLQESLKLIQSGGFEREGERDSAEYIT